MGKYVTSSTAVYDADGKLAGYSTYKREESYSERFTYRYENGWMGWLCRTKSVAVPKVFYELTCLLQPGSNILYFSPVDRKRLKRNYQISEVTLCAALNELERENVIIRRTLEDKETGEIFLELSHGQIVINPHIAWKGNSDSRDAAIELFDRYVENKNRIENGTR